MGDVKARGVKSCKAAESLRAAKYERRGRNKEIFQPRQLGMRIFSQSPHLGRACDVGKWMLVTHHRDTDKLRRESMSENVLMVGAWAVDRRRLT